MMPESKFYRRRDYGADLNAEFDELAKRINKSAGSGNAEGSSDTGSGAASGGGSTTIIRETITTTSPSGVSLVHMGLGVITKGQVVGFSGGKTTPAVASKVGFVRGCFVATQSGGSGSTLIFAQSGKIGVVLEAGINPTAGDPVYLSATTPGAVRDAAPEGERRQVLGVFVGGRQSDGTAPALLNIDLGVIN